MHHHPSLQRRLRHAVAALLAGGLLAGLALVEPVAAQDLEDRRDEVTKDIGRRAAQLDQSADRLVVATRRQQQAETGLREAQDTLARTRGELAAAKAFDARMQLRLDAAVEDLREAREDLAERRRRVSGQETRLARIAVETYQSGDPALMALSMVLNSQDAVRLGDQLNSVQSVLDKETVALQRLEASRVVLTVQESRFEEARAEVAERRAAAAENLRRKAELESRAEQAEAEIAQLVVAAASAREEAAAAKAEDQRQLRDLESERDRISVLLRQRAREARAAARAAAEARRQARAKARARAAAEAREAARKAAAAKRAAHAADRAQAAQQAREAAREAREAERARERAHRAAQAVSRSGARSASSSVLSSPVDGYLTSSYGMRLHPVYKRWTLHDGTDFGAACGTPIRAAADGTVIAAYSHSAYGNRVIIDHGYQRGVGLGTAYNHMSGFDTHVGQRVRRGDVIGYVGTTGYSTGCHLHFMVFENGGTVDPMGWL